MKIIFGIPAYGSQHPKWWSRIATMAAHLGKSYGGIIHSGSMATDINRNIIVERFLETDADWLFWIDADTIVPLGGIKRLLALDKSLTSGLYYSKNNPSQPIAYTLAKDNRYNNIVGWVPGEIIPIDAAGMGCCLVHRDVFIDIKQSYTVVQRNFGGITAVHNKDIIGKIPRTRKSLDGKVKKGVLQERVWIPENYKYKWPFFALEYGRTEDMWFFEIAARSGHKLWLDTSVECSHLGFKEHTRDDYTKRVIVETMTEEIPVSVLETL